MSLREIVESGDKQRLEAFCNGIRRTVTDDGDLLIKRMTYRDVRQAAIDENVDLDELEELLWSIS